MITRLINEVEELNDKGEYIKTVTQKKYIFGFIRYHFIKQVTRNNITQSVLDSIEGDGESSKGSIGFKKGKK